MSLRDDSGAGALRGNDSTTGRSTTGQFFAGQSCQGTETLHGTAGKLPFGPQSAQAKARSEDVAVGTISGKPNHPAPRYGIAVDCRGPGSHILLKPQLVRHRGLYFE